MPQSKMEKEIWSIFNGRRSNLSVYLHLFFHSISVPLRTSTVYAQERNPHKGKAKVVDAVWGRNWKAFIARMFWEKGWIEKWRLCGMGALEKWMIIRYTPHQTTTLTKWMFLQKNFFKSSWPLNEYVQQPAATTFVFPSVRFLLYVFPIRN